MTNELVRHLINSINEATANIPCWDEYVDGGKVGPAALSSLHLHACTSLQQLPDTSGQLTALTWAAAAACSSCLAPSAT
jgi:hypothetical protein